jgi:hypothetical protein
LLCYLEGKTRDEAAQELGWSPGSVKGRLERGRELLRARLSRRGLALSAVLCASLLPESAASAAIPISLATATVSAGMQFVSGQAAVTVSAQVLSLTQGVLHAMLWTKIKIATVLILTISALGIGGAIGSKQWQSAAAAESGSSQWQSEDNKPWQLPTATAPADFAEADPPLAFQDNKRERGKEERGQEVSQVRGQVREIDTVKGTISLLLAPARGERKQEIKTYSLASKDIKIVPTFGRRAKLADLKQGMWVTAGLSEEMDVIGIRVDNPVVSGILKPVEAKNRIILNPGRGNDLELNLDADAKFNLNGKPAAFLDFKEGMRVVAYLSLDRTMVVALRGGEDPGRRDNARRDGDGRDGRRPHYGIIVGIHPAKNSIEVLVGSNITIQGNEDLKIESYELAKGWIIHGSGNRIRPGKVTDLVKAIRVNLEWSADKKTVTKITLDDPVLRGTILAVDAVKKSITLELGRGADKTLPLSKDATITVAGKAATLADLKERMPAIVTLSLDRNQVVGIVIAGRPAERR